LHVDLLVFLQSRIALFILKVGRRNGRSSDKQFPEYRRRVMPSSRAERLIASMRLALATFSLFALALCPIEPNSLGWLRLSVVILYSVYAAVLGRLVSRGEGPLLHVRAIQAADVGACFLFLSVSGGIESLFVPFFVFALVAASLRWRWQGALWTSMAIMTFLTAMAAYTVLSGNPDFEIQRFLLDASGLAVTGILVGRVETHEERAHRVAENLALPPASSGSETDTLRRLAEWAASIVGAPCVLIAWEESDEPWLYLAWLDRGEFRYTQERPGVMDPVVPERLAEATFLWEAVETARPAVLYQSPDGLKRWQGVPLHPTLQARFTPRSILSVIVVTDVLRGRLFFFDKPGLIVDDMAFAQLVARHITTRLVHLPLLRRPADRTALSERLRLARDLHDGTLHSLAGVALELEHLVRESRFDQAATRRCVLEVQESLLEEQRNIRQVIAQLREDTRDVAPADASLAARLEGLARRLKRQWGLRAECVLAGLDSLPARWRNEIYLIVHEALINAARHANASHARFEVTAGDGRVTIAVADNGQGLQFRGRCESALAAELNIGPATLRERVALLGGAFAIESSEFGTRIEITLAVEQTVAA
jgi:signal transduction histidine kinase